MDYYNETGCCITAVPTLMVGEEVHIDKIFVMPSMTVRKNGTEGRTCMRGSSGDVTTRSITTIHELFQKDGQPIRRVCISGDAGQGKTTLCREIISTWCKVHSNIEIEPETEYQFLKSFELLFYLPLRNYKQSDVIKVIKSKIVRPALHNALKEFLEKESEKCLIILDGLDEWLPSEDCKVNVPYIDPREKFTVLITSRPWKLEVLRLMTSEIGQEVELNWIENDKLIEDVVNVLNNKYQKKRNWRRFKYTEGIPETNETYVKLKHLAEVPIMLTRMLCMWYDDEEIGNTRVEIYIKMMEYLFRVANTRDKKTCDLAMRPHMSTHTLLVNVFKDFEYCAMYSEILFKLSDLAYHTLFNEKRENSLVFPHSVTKIYMLEEHDVNFCLIVGILSQTKSYCKASSHTKSISFLHKTFQEFLAALYIASEEKDRSLNEMLNKLKSLDDVFEMSQMLIFLSELRPDLKGDIRMKGFYGIEIILQI